MFVILKYGKMKWLEPRVINELLTIKYLKDQIITLIIYNLK